MPQHILVQLHVHRFGTSDCKRKRCVKFTIDIGIRDEHFQTLLNLSYVSYICFDISLLWTHCDQTGDEHFRLTRLAVQGVVTSRPHVCPPPICASRVRVFVVATDA